MKTRNFKKIALLTMSLILIVGAIFATTANAATTPEISNMNVKYTDKFCLVYAVPADSVQGGSATLYIYEQYPEEAGVNALKEYTVTKTTAAADSGLDYDAYIFYTDGVSAMALDKVLYAQVVDAKNNVSSAKSYSVVEYLYTRLAEVDGKANTEVQNGLYKSIIDFGTYAQKQFLKADVLANTTLISDYCYVSTEGCTVDGKTAAVIPQNKAFDVVGDKGALTACTVTTYDTYDTTGTATVTEVEGYSVTITGSARAHIVAGEIKTVRPGTETFEGYEVGKGMPISNYTSGKYLFYGNDASLRSQTVALDNVYGEKSTVLPITLSVGQINMYPLSSTVAAADAKAFEFSFDIKIDSSAANADYKAANNGSNAERLGWHFYLMNGDNKIGKDVIRVFANYGNKLRVDANQDYSKYVITDNKASEWHNLRVVFRNNADETQTNVEFYLDGAETPTVYTMAKYTPISDISKVRLERIDTTYDKKTVMYFDNVWCGYLAE